MASVTIPVSLGGTNVAYNDGTGAYGMASNNGYGYVTYLIPMLSEVVAACSQAVTSANTATSMQSLFNRIYLGGY
jgi:hypothetical protein